MRLKRPESNKSASLQQPKRSVTAMNQIWSMDFLADALFDDRKLGALKAVIEYVDLACRFVCKPGRWSHFRVRGCPGRGGRREIWRG